MALPLADSFQSPRNTVLNHFSIRSRRKLGGLIRSGFVELLRSLLVAKFLVRFCDVQVQGRVELANSLVHKGIGVSQRLKVPMERISSRLLVAGNVMSGNAQFKVAGRLRPGLHVQGQRFIEAMLVFAG